jgi:hypothetical protein
MTAANAGSARLLRFRQPDFWRSDIALIDSALLCLVGANLLSAVIGSVAVAIIGSGFVAVTVTVIVIVAVCCRYCYWEFLSGFPLS